MPDETTTPPTPNTPAPQQAAPAGPVPDPIDADPDIPATPPGWHEKAWRQFRAGRTEVASSKAAVAEATAQLAAVKEAHAREIAEIRRDADRRVAWATTAPAEGSPLSHPDVRRVVERSYDDAIAGQKSPPAFDAWLKTEAPKSPVLAPYFAAAAAASAPANAAQAQQQAQQAPPARTDAGAKPHAPIVNVPTREQRRELVRSGQWTKDHEAAYRAELARKTGVKF